MGVPVNYPGQTPPSSTGSTTTRPRTSQYTEAVRDGGIGAVREARQQRRWGSSSVDQQIADSQAATGYNGHPTYAQPAQRSNDLYDQWYASVMPAGAATEYGYGRNGGDYAGFKTEGGLKNWVRGRAEAIRAEDDARFRALDEMSNQRLDQAEADYDAARAVKVDDTYHRTVPTIGDDVRVTPERADTWSARATPVEQRPNNDHGAELFGSDAVGDALAAMYDEWRTPSSSSEGLTRADAASADRWTAMANQQAAGDKMAAFIDTELNPWLATTTEPLLEQQDFAQQGLATPIAAYAQRAGNEVGVDPNIIGGWYPAASAIGDAADRRDLDMLAATGMDWGDTQQALNQMDTDVRRAEQDAAQYQDDLDEQTRQQLNDFVYQATGAMDADRLASATGVLPQDVANIVSTDAFQVYNQDIYNALQTSDAPSDAIDVIAGTLDAAATQDPAMFNVLQAIWKDYLPSDYQVLGG